MQLIEWVMPADGDMPDAFMSWDATSIDLTILSTGGDGGGRVWTAEEFRGMLEASGLQLNQIIPTASSVSVIEARPTLAEFGIP